MPGSGETGQQLPPQPLFLGARSNHEILFKLEASKMYPQKSFLKRVLMLSKSQYYETDSEFAIFVNLPQSWIRGQLFTGPLVHSGKNR